MAVPFGFSAGDFIAAIQLVHKVTTALREVDGASSHYNQTISQLQGLEGLLRSVQSVYSADVDPHQLDKLHFLGFECYIPLNRFFSNIKVLEPSLGNREIENHHIIDRARRAAQKIHWGIQVKKELSELETAMGPRIGAINMQLLLIHSERQEKTGSSLSVLTHMLHSLNSQMENSQNSLDIQINSLATSTSVDNVLRALRDMRLEAANDRNTQLDIIRKDIGNQMGCFDTKSSERVLRSIELLNSRIEDHFARSRTSPAQNTALPSPVLRPCMPVDPGLLCHDHNAMQRVEEQLATHTQLLQLLTERDLRPQSSGSMLHENDNGMIRDCQRTIKQSIEVMLSLFKAGVNALLLKLWIALPFVQHILRALRAPPLLVSVPIADFILFEDALGRIAHLPYLHFRHHAVFMARLRCEFKNVPGEKKVLLEQFRIFSQKHCNNFLTEDNWEHAVEPGSKIAMSILLNSHGSKGDICPRCGTIKTEMDAADLSKCTVCELNWALQESRPTLTSSSTERFNEVISAPTLAQDVFEVAENESSSSSTSSPDPPEVTVPLVDNDDIKSFKMVHIQLLNERADREAISLTPRFLETTFPFWESRSYQPTSYERLTVDSALMEIIQSLHLYGPNRSGSIYICWYEGSPQILRIGRTTRNVEQRLRHWRNKCRVQYISDPHLYNGTAMETSFVAHVERLIHVELKNYRMDVFCEGCGKTHTELFRVSKEHVLKVFQKWKDWVAREPYMSTGNGRWMLKPSFLAHAREICRPLAMKE